MPREGISLYFDIQDGASQVLSSIGDKTKALDKETQLLAQATEVLNKSNKNLLVTQGQLQSELTDAKKKVREAKKAYEELGDELSKTNYDNAINEQAELQNQLASVNTQITANRKAYREYVETLRKSAAGDAPAAIASTGAGDADSLLEGIGKSGVIAMVGNSLSDALGAGLESALGQPLASAVNSALSGAVSGFALGGAPGAIAGLAAGALSGIVTVKSDEDAARIAYYNDLYDDVNAATEEMIAAGSGIAGSREQTRLAFAQRLGSDEAAMAYLAEVEGLAAGTNYGYDEIVGYAKLLLNSYDKDEVFAVLQTLSDATAGMSLSSSDVEMMIKGLSRMRTTGKTTQEYLNYFSERGVDVYAALADALGVDKSGIAGMVTAGEIEGSFAAQAILSYIDSTYGGLSEDLMGTYDAISDNLEDVLTSIEAAGGVGYNTLRAEGKQADIDAYTGELGEAMKMVNQIKGENLAYMENLSGQYQREAAGAVLMGAETTLFTPKEQARLEELRTDYLAALEAYNAGDQAAGLTVERLVEETEALATAAYESSTQYQNLVDSQEEQIAAIRENTAGLAAATNAYRLSQERGKGYLSSTGIDKEEWEGIAKGAAWSYQNDVWYDDGGNAHNVAETGDGWYDDGGNWHAYAYGLTRVPFDNYPALLHEGERVLTAAEARSRDGAGGTVIQVTVTGNTIAGAGEELADQIAEVIARKLEQAALLAEPRS